MQETQQNIAKAFQDELALRQHRSMVSTGIFVAVLGFFSVGYYIVLNHIPLRNLSVFLGIVGILIASYRLMRIEVNTALHLTFVSMAGLTYLYSAITWQSTPMMAGYFAAFLVWVYFRVGGTIAKAWAIVCMILVCTLPWVSARFFPEHAVALEEVGRFNVITLLFIFAFIFLVVFITNDMSRELVRHFSTEKKRFEQMHSELQKSQQNFLQAQSYRQQFFSSINHEIRTPMNAVQGIAQVLANNKNLLAEESELVQALQYASTHLFSIINDLLDASKYESLETKPTITEVDLRAVLYEAHMIALYPAVEKKLALRMELPTSLPNKIYSNANRLRQLLVHLLNNAVKHTDHGFVALECEVVESPSTSEAAKLRITIRDSGCGIREIDQLKVLGTNNQLATAQSVGVPEQSVGLPATKSIVESLGGTIRCESEVGVGTSFIVELPLAVPAVANTQVVTPVVMSQERLEKPYLIMIVEDIPLNVLVVQRLLNQRSVCRFLTAENGQQALLQLEDALRFGELPQLILMDMHMPVMGGVQTTQTIRAHHDIRIANLPIIAMTANTAEVDIQACFEAGMNDYISKPLDINALIFKIKKLLELPTA